MTKTTSNTLIAVLGKDVLKENKMEDPNDDNTALDKQSFLPKGVPLGKQSNTKDLKYHIS